ncbi:MAG: polysaccharide deacetylase family protein [Ferruginibacter sp.]
MKKYSFAICLILLNLSFCIGQTQQIIYTISPWPDNKKAAVSLTFDDGISGQFTIAVPLLNDHGFKATFFVTTKTVMSQLGDWHLVKAAAAAGHEIANHALTHPHFDTMSADNIAAELVQSNALIEDNIKPAKSFTHAYPYGQGGQATDTELKIRAVVKKYFIGARATRNRDITFNKYDFAISEDDYYKVNSDVIADAASMAGFEKQLDETITAGGWYVPTYHGIENGWIIVSKNIFEKHLTGMDKRLKYLWIAPFANVLKYHQERNCAKLVPVSENSRSWILKLTDTLGNSATWDQPLTINLKPQGRKIKSIQQASRKISFTASGDEIIFNALPGNDEIVITKN